jgi:sterol desaturase/sphingolipid hydroxylase (fatty acid hydroxylase superfamily)
VRIGSRWWSDLGLAADRGPAGELVVRARLRRWHPVFWLRVARELGRVVVRVELAVTLRSILLALAAIALLAFLAGCAPGAHTVATDLEVVERPVEKTCVVEWPAKPVPHVALVQLTGVVLVDLVLIWRAAEAELEERIAYEIKLEAAARRCLEDPP